MKLFPALLMAVLLLIISYHSILLKRKNISLVVRKMEYYVFVAYYWAFVYTVFAAAFYWPYPEGLIRPLFSHPLAHAAGNILCFAGVVGYAACAVALRESYRIGIDEKTAGPLATTGIYSFSRNPLYVSLLSLYLGLFLVYANIALLAHLLLSAALIHRQTLREEAFLRVRYLDAYLEYCKKVGRYF